MTVTAPPLDAGVLRQTFAHYPSGVAALAGMVDGAPSVLVASSFTVGVSLEPPLVMLAVQKTSTTWPLLQRAERIGVSVLGDNQGNLCRQLSSKQRESRLEGVSLEYTPGGGVLIEGAAVVLECSIFAEHPAGDHDIVVLEVHSLEARSLTNPLVFHGSRFRRLTAED